MAITLASRRPVLIDTITVPTDSALTGTDSSPAPFEQPYFCPGGHDFVLAFPSEQDVTADYAECPHCTAYATTNPNR